MLLKGVIAVRHVGSSWIRGQACVSCSGRWNSLPLRHQGSPGIRMLKINLFLDVWLASIFSHFVGCLFTLLFPLLWGNFLVCRPSYVSVVFVFGIMFMKSLPKPVPWGFSPLYFFRSVGLQSISSWFLCRVWDRGSVSFFYAWICSFPAALTRETAPSCCVALAPVDDQLAVRLCI